MIDPLPATTGPAVDPALVEFAVDIAREAGELTLGYFRQPDLAVEGKDDGTPVTVADRGAWSTQSRSPGRDTGSTAWPLPTKASEPVRPNQFRAAWGV